MFEGFLAIDKEAFISLKSKNSNIKKLFKPNYELLTNFKLRRMLKSTAKTRENKKLKTSVRQKSLTSSNDLITYLIKLFIAK